MKQDSFRVRFSYFLLAIILFFYSVIVAKDFLFPLSLGVLAAYLIYPIVNFLEKKRFPRILAIAIVLTLIIITLYFSASFIYNRLEHLVKELPNLKKQALSNIDMLITAIETKLPIGNTSMKSFLSDRIDLVFESGSEIFNTVFTATAGTLFKFFLLPVYIFLFLFYRTKFAHFILMVVPSEKRFTTVSILRDISMIVPKYLGGVMMVVIIMAIFNSIGLMVIGIKYAIIIGVISGILSFIPYFGSILGGGVAIGFTLLTASNPLIAVQVAIFYLIMIFLEHNLFTPNIVGNSLRINPFIIILSLIIAASIWGVAGMVVIMPFMAFLKVIAKNSPGLKPYSFLLGIRGARHHSIHFPTIKEIIKRKREVPNEED